MAWEWNFVTLCILSPFHQLPNLWAQLPSPPPSVNNHKDSVQWIPFHWNVLYSTVLCYLHYYGCSKLLHIQYCGACMFYVPFHFLKCVRSAVCSQMQTESGIYFIHPVQFNETSYITTFLYYIWHSNNTLLLPLSTLSHQIPPSNSLDFNFCCFQVPPKLLYGYYYITNTSAFIYNITVLLQIYIHPVSHHYVPQMSLDYSLLKWEFLTWRGLVPHYH